MKHKGRQNNSHEKQCAARVNASGTVFRGTGFKCQPCHLWGMGLWMGLCLWFLVSFPLKWSDRGTYIRVLWWTQADKLSDNTHHGWLLVNTCYIVTVWALGKGMAGIAYVSLSWGLLSDWGNTTLGSIEKAQPGSEGRIKTQSDSSELRFWTWETEGSEEERVKM